MPINQIVLVGHCSFDTGSLYSFIQQSTDTPIKSANNDQDIQEIATPDSLLLVNRVLPGSFNTDSGIELIKQLSQSDSPPRMILISDLSEAQQLAEDAGALPGFGKGQLNDEFASDRFTTALQ
ncbi:hypothetical protein JD969_05425 [Planctomycetota bacterium]|nr:hypothetical protein JD969_05425 [Planctomycetota bacterium]